MAGYYSTKHWLSLRAEALKRDRNTCTTPGCGSRATHVDHKKTRPRVSYPTPFDVLDNLQSLCKRCDDQIKELGSRRKGHGKAYALGCTADGTPRDPRHHWR